MYNNIKYILFLFIFIFLSSTKTINAQVVINEINPSGEWVELYKSSSGPLSLENCTIFFQDTKSQKKTLTALDNFLETDVYKVINTDGSYLNNSSSDTVSLECLGFNLDPITYGDNIGTKSYARIPNGTGSFVNTDQVTQGLQNPDPTPEPTAVPTQTATALPTPTTTSTATPTKTSTPQITSKPTPTKTPSAKPSPTSTSEPEEEETQQPNQIENETETDEVDQVTPQPTGQVAGATDIKRSPVVAIVFILLGVCCLGYVGYMIYNMNHQNDQRNIQKSD